MVAADVSELRKLLDEKKLVIGTEKTKKALNEGRLKKVYVSSNIPGFVRDEIKHVAKIAGAVVVEVDETNDQLGVLCRKPFSISVCGA